MIFALSDSWNSERHSQQWTTISNNSWDGVGTWINAERWSGSANVTDTFTRSSNALVVSGGGIEALYIYGMNSEGARIDLDENGLSRLRIIVPVSVAILAALIIPITLRRGCEESVTN